MIKAVIFDLDGTLSYTLDSIAMAGNLSLQAVGLMPCDKDEYKYFCGDGADELVRRMLRFSGDEECLLYDKARSEYAKYFAEYAQYNVRPYDGMPQTLEALKARGLKLAVLSNKPHPQTVEVVHRLYGKDMFSYIQGNTPEIKRKPSPDGANIIINEFGIEPEECLYVGDTATDMQTGNGAKAQTVGVLWGYRDKKELEDGNAKFIISSPEELLDLIG